MTVRTFIATTTAAAALLAPGAASAMPAGPDAPQGHADLAVTSTAASPTTASASGGSGTGTATVVIIAAGALLAGAASGVGGTRVASRRRTVRI